MLEEAQFSIMSILPITRKVALAVPDVVLLWFLLLAYHLTDAPPRDKLTHPLFHAGNEAPSAALERVLAGDGESFRHQLGYR
jgi:hypothetical protein